jgi:hypothetical protein
MDGCLEKENGGIMSYYTVSHMQVIYFVILVIAGIMELSPKFDTTNFIKKFALMLIIIGALAHLARRDQPIMEIGFSVLLMVELVGSYCYRIFDRRHGFGERKKERRTT